MAEDLLVARLASDMLAFERIKAERHPVNKWCPYNSSCTTPDSEDMCHGNYAHCGIYQEKLNGAQK